MIKHIILGAFFTALFLVSLAMGAAGNVPPTASASVIEVAGEEVVVLLMEDQILPSFEVCAGLPGNARMNCNFDLAYPRFSKKEIEDGDIGVDDGTYDRNMGH